VLRTLTCPAAPIHTCDFCGTAIQLAVVAGGTAPGAAGNTAQFIIKEHFIVKCAYNQETGEKLARGLGEKIPGAPQDFEEAANISKLNLTFYPLWVGEYSVTSDYVGIDNWPQFAKPAHDRPGWYEMKTYYKKEESGRVIREYQKPLMAVDMQNLPKYLRTTS